MGQVKSARSDTRKGISVVDDDLEDQPLDTMWELIPSLGVFAVLDRFGSAVSHRESRFQGHLKIDGLIVEGTELDQVLRSQSGKNIGRVYVIWQTR